MTLAASDLRDTRVTQPHECGDSAKGFAFRDGLPDEFVAAFVCGGAGARCSAELRVGDGHVRECKASLPLTLPTVESKLSNMKRRPTPAIASRRGLKTRGWTAESERVRRDLEVIGRAALLPAAGEKKHPQTPRKDAA